MIITEHLAYPLLFLSPAWDYWGLGIVSLPACDFIRLVLIAIVAAVPVAWYAMNKWLQDFAYKTNLDWTIFALSGLLAILIAMITISSQSVKAALVNLVKSLKQ